METNGFEKYAKAWNKADLSAGSQMVYSEEQIKKIKMKTSKDFSRSINNSIVFDYVFKGILILGMILLAWFYKTNPAVLIAIFSLIGLSALFIYMEINIKKGLRTIDDYSKEVSEVIKMKLSFYKQRITPLKLMMAYTNALFVWVGSMFYFYSKYGYYKMEDFGDLFVTILIVTLAFSISYFAFTWQVKTNVMELQESLSGLDEQQADVLHMQLERKRKQKMAMAIIAAIGIFLLSVLLIIYFR